MNGCLYNPTRNTALAAVNCTSNSVLLKEKEKYILRKMLSVDGSPRAINTTGLAADTVREAPTVTWV